MLVILGAILGTVNALVWYFGFIPFVRAMIPFALFFVVLIFVVTAVLKSRCGNTPEVILTSTCSALRKYSPVIIISAAIFVVFSIVVLATFLPFPVRFALAFIGSISFWTMLFEFVAMIFCMWFRR